MVKYDLGFGDPIVIREALSQYIGTSSIAMDYYVTQAGYGNKSGDPNLLHQVKKLIKDFIGKEYKYNFISNGATGGVNVALKALRPIIEKTITMFPANEILGTTKPLLFYRRPAFHYYKDMVALAGYQHTNNSHLAAVRLVDSPRNPTGELDLGELPTTPSSSYTVWDAAYHSPIYNKLFMNIVPKHDIMVGSFGKTTGLTGLRIGWISTDNDQLAVAIEKALHADSLGVSQYSQKFSTLILSRLPSNLFFNKAAYMVDDNREELSKLKNLFQTDVPSTGMFYYAPVSGYLESTLKEMGVSYVDGLSLEGAPGWGRFSLAQRREVVRDFVKEIKKRDG